MPTLEQRFSIGTEVINLAFGKDSRINLLKDGLTQETKTFSNLPVGIRGGINLPNEISSPK